MFYDFAHEFKNIKGWINSEPLTLRDLRGKIVLLDFWTYSCVNCVRTLPHLKLLHEKYADAGLVIVGVHTPEFEFEREEENVRAAVEKYGIKHPVALDSENTTWILYGNRYWPKQVLIDSRGRIRYEHAGEGGYAEIEEKIIELLAEIGVQVEASVRKLGREEKFKLYKAFAQMTPEIYLGSKKGQGFGNSQVCVPGSCIRFIDRGEHLPNKVYLSGDWIQDLERIRHATDEEGYIALKYTASQVNVVAGPYSAGKFKVYVLLDGKPLTRKNAGKDILFAKDGQSFFLVYRPDMFEIVDTQHQEQHEVKLIVHSSEATFYTFTFG
jgi:thiol-disulfide isomerase/thioredoxin